MKSHFCWRLIAFIIYPTYLISLNCSTYSAKFKNLNMKFEINLPILRLLDFMNLIVIYSFVLINYFDLFSKLFSLIKLV